MKITPAPELICRSLSDIDITDWNDIERAFADSDACELQQAWLDAPETGFQPARVRVGWRNSSPHGAELWIYAELSDLDIFNDAKELNDRTYELGDLSEILVRPVDQEDYFEFHITPENQKFQLHWPDAEAIWKFDGQYESLNPYFVPGVLLRSQTQVQSADNRWRVLAMVPANVARSGSTLAGTSWAFSFSRYDCARGVNEPVLSSCSPHAAPRFHRQQEWGRLTFADS